MDSVQTLATEELGKKRVRVDSSISGGGSPNVKRARRNLRFTVGADYLPKDDPEMPLGQDAHFICSTTFGIADGVGGLLKKGIDSGVYARELMENAYEFVEYESFGTMVDPAEALIYAYDKSTSLGASTACIITISDDLRYVSLGDSGFLVIRQGEVVYKSPIQQDGHLPQVIATKLVKEARDVSLSKEGTTPWTLAAQTAGVTNEEETYLGGKCDDITVIVASIY